MKSLLGILLICLVVFAATPIAAQEKEKPASASTETNPYSSLVRTWESGGRIPTTITIQEVKPNGEVVVSKYVRQGREIPVTSATASLTGDKQTPVKFNFTATGSLSVAEFDLTLWKGPLLMGTVKSTGYPAGEIKFYPVK